MSLRAPLPPAARRGGLARRAVVDRVWAAMDTALPCWLVGGFVRDQLLGRPSRDLDLALDADVSQAAAPARRLAAACGVRPHLVGTAPHAVWRVETAALKVELWPRGALSLEADLLRRDFTVNALAYRLPAGPLVDLVGGLDDIEHRRLRAVRRANLVDDPVRILRAARFRATHPELALEPRTAQWLGELAPLVARAPRERLGQELAALLAGTAPGRGLAALLELTLLAPAAPVAGLVDEAWLRTRAGAASTLTPAGRHPLRAAVRGSRATTALALLIRAWGCPDEATLAPYAWPRQRRHDACAVAANLDRAAAVVGSGPAADRRELLWRVGDASPALIAAGAAIALATGAEIAPWRRLWRLWRTQRAVLTAAEPLLAPAEIIDLLGLDRPGPPIGRALRQVARARARGEIRTAAQARRLVRRGDGANS